MAFDARVLLLAADDGRIGPLAAGLDALGWRTVTARDVVSGEMTLKDFPLEAAVVDIDGLGEDVALRLRAAAEPRRLPILVVGARPDSIGGADMTMSVPPHPAQAALRLEQLGRAAIAEEEFRASPPSPRAASRWTPAPRTTVLCASWPPGSPTAVSWPCPTP